jgi:WD40 repeat protein
MSRPLFISYSRTDHAAVLPLLDQLRAAQYDPWLDQTSIPVSVPWLDEIQKAIRSAELVLVIDTPAWRASNNCQVELRIAQSLGKVIVGLNAAQPGAWLTAVERAYSGLGGAEIAYARLLGDSYRWRAAGQRRTHMASGRLLKVYRRLLRARPHPDAHAVAFVARSVRAARFRFLRAALATTLTISLVLGYALSRSLHDELIRRDQQRSAQLAVTSMVNTKLDQAPYAGLQQAITSARQEGTSSYVGNAALASALELNLPVSIDNPSHQRPQPASALAATTARRGTSTATLDIDVNVVRVKGPSGELRIPTTGAVTALAWSPDGDRLAIADSRGVSVIRLPQGRTIAVLRGLEGAVDNLTWPAEDRIEGRAGELIATWGLSGTILAKTTSWFMDLAANSDGTKALGIGRDGSRTLIAGTRVVTSAPINGLITTTLTWAEDRWAVVGQTSGTDGEVVVVDTDGKIIRTWPSKGCASSSIAAGSGNTVLLACTAAQTIRVLDLDTGAIQDTSVPDFRPVNAVLDQDGSVLATSEYDELVRVVDRHSTLLRGGATLCATGAGIVKPSPDRDRVLIGGQLPLGCTFLSDDIKTRGTTHALVARGADLFAMRTATWAKDGTTFVTGWASGQLWFFDPVLYADRLIVSPTGSEIRGVAFNADQSELIVVTRDGEVVSYPTQVPLASFGERIKVLAQRLQVGIDAGLAGA